MTILNRSLFLGVLASTFSLLPGWAEALNLVREEMRVEQAWSRFGVSGEDVVVVIIDRGIDYRHPDFIKPNGKTRIKWILDMTGQIGCPGSPPPKEYSEAEINAALAGGREVPSYDRVGHGTATAGAAAGNGLALNNKRFRGIAYEADIIVIKHTSEGAAAHDGIPAEQSFISCLKDAFEWLEPKLVELGKPAVAVINSGVQAGGPQDGTSIVSQLIDEYFGGRPGRIMVIPSGDEGSLPSHAGGSFGSSPTVVKFNKSSTANTPLVAWYSGETPAEVKIEFDNGASISAMPGQVVEKDGITLFHYTPGTEFWFNLNSGGDRQAFAFLGANQGRGSISFQALGGGRGTFDVYSDVLGPNLTAVTRFSDHLAPGRSTDYASSRSAIKAGNSVIRTGYTDINGDARGVFDEGTPGELWLKSGRGPTRDGRLAVDVVLPGEGSFVSLAKDSFYDTLPGVQPIEGKGKYVRFGGTSAASPLLTGAVALMLEMKPTLTSDEVRDILHATADADNETGNVPNQAWGHGRIDLFQALQKLAGVPVSAAHSGTWYDTAHSGEGWILQILEPETTRANGTKVAGSAVVFWFTYPPPGQPGQQAWILSVGKVTGDKILFEESQAPVGGIFGPGFDPGTVNRKPWGSFEFRFIDCDNGVMTYRGPDKQWGNGYLNLQRLTRLLGQNCAKTQVAKANVDKRFSGIWFDPSHNGEGFIIERIANNQAVVYWFTYDNSGRQAWFLGVGSVNGMTIDVDLSRPVGPVFGPNFDPDDGRTPSWGSATFTFQNCNQGTMTYTSTQPGFGSGSQNLTRLSGVAGLGCGE